MDQTRVAKKIFKAERYTKVGKAHTEIAVRCRE
jgi:hypothetical protein